MLDWQILHLLCLRNSRTLLFLHRKSNPVFTLWQQLVLLTIRQYEDNRYLIFVECLVEAHYLRMFLQLSHIPHFATSQKSSDRVNNIYYWKIISSFIILTGIRHIFAGINSTGFKVTHAFQYYTERYKLRRKIC